MSQVSGGAKAHGLRVITGLLDRVEDPVDDTAVVMDMAVAGGTEAVDEAHRPEAVVTGVGRSASARPRGLR